ncbi:hypothetical protein HDU93_005074 [Gonapodya sp. JEL0774]|nr:hypothetical protein HDU93_005074 [Gonapodya sp. JEL0774]
MFLRYLGTWSHSPPPSKSVSHVLLTPLQPKTAPTDQDSTVANPAQDLSNVDAPAQVLVATTSLVLPKKTSTKAQGTAREDQAQLRPIDEFERFQAMVVTKLPPLWEIEAKDITCTWHPKKDKIGEGGYGTVFKGTWLGHLPVALKTAKFQDGYDGKEQAFDREASLWFRLSSPHVLNLHGIARTADALVFVCPILENGDVKHYLDQERFSNMHARHQEVLKLLLHFARGIQYLHERRIVHADIKPPNLLVDGKGRGVIGDFGVCKILPQTGVPAPDGSSSIDPNDLIDEITGNRGGTPRYMSPERLRGEGTTEKDDVYAFSLIIYELWTSKNAYDELLLLPNTQKDLIYQLLTSSQSYLRPRVDKSTNMPVELERLMEQCWAYHPDDRPLFVEIVKKLEEMVPPSPDHAVQDATIAELDSPSTLAAVFELAGNLRYGRNGKQQDLWKAAYLYERAATEGHELAQVELSFCYARGLGVIRKDLTQAFTWCLQAGNSGNMLAQNTLGRYYYYGEGVAPDFSEAVKWWRKAADQGYPNAQTNLGNCYNKGEGVEKDLKEAVTWYEKAADQGYVAAQLELANCYYNAQGTDQDLVKAVEWYKMAADQGYAAAQFNLGNCYNYGQGVETDMVEAVKWYRKATEQGHAAAQFNLGNSFFNEQGAVNLTEAVEWWRRAADQGFASAQFNLGVAYATGQGVGVNFGESVVWFRKAADQGNSYAQVDLGNCYYNGQGVKQNFVDAIKWYRKAADQGEAAAQFYLGVGYANGQGEEKDLKEAVTWYRKAADQAHVAAQLALGNCYYNGQGVDQDLGEAVKWFMKAADQGYVAAQFNLGACYVNGHGVKQDYRDAVKWFGKAADQNHAAAQLNLGNSYYNGVGVNKDLGEAVKWFMKAAEQGKVDAQYMLGVCYANGHGVKQDYFDAVNWYNKAAQKGHAVAQCNLGSCYYEGLGVKSDKAEGVNWWRMAANQGHAIAQHNLAECLRCGRGTDRKLQESQKWFRKAADQGLSFSQFNLAYYFYLHGLGVTECDLVEAEELFVRAADGNHIKSLGVLYERGWGGRAKDEEKAIEHYKSDLSEESKTLLGTMYEEGRGGLERDLAKAVELYTKAVEEAGDQVAQAHLGQMHELGLGGVPMDLSKAIELYKLADTSKSREALARLNEK